MWHVIDTIGLLTGLLIPWYSSLYVHSLVRSISTPCEVYFVGHDYRRMASSFNLRRFDDPIQSNHVILPYWWSLRYADCIHCRETKDPPPQKKSWVYIYTWCHVPKLFVLGIVTWAKKCLLRTIIRLHLISLFNAISTFEGYLMPNQPL